MRPTGVDEPARLRDELRALVRAYWERRTPEPFVAGETPIPLIVPSFGWEEAWAVLDTFLGGQVTMGDKVRSFEDAFAAYIGVRRAIMVNSGSSANLIALSALTNPAFGDGIRAGDEIITPAVTWATTVFPIANCGAVPVLVDVEPDTFDIDPEQIERAITPKTRAIMLVHLLGNPARMREISDIAQRHKLFVIEDSCEAHGAEYGGRKVGSIGDISTFSFYFSHHISTIEGGMVLTDDDDLAELARTIRVFGWTRALRDPNSVAAQHPDIDPRYLFSNVGYNVRPTELQGAMGLEQLPRLEGFIDGRRRNAAYWGKHLAEAAPWLQLQSERPDTRHVWFGYPLIVKEGAPFTRDQLKRFLESKRVETRPIMSGNMDQQPAMRLLKYRKVGELPVAQFVHRSGLYFGNHLGIGPDEREAIVRYVREFGLVRSR